MHQISIVTIDETHYEVSIQAHTPTTHVVTVLPEYANKLNANNIEVLLKESFAFLLARESNTSILRSFELGVISRYFPEYEAEITKKLKG